MKEKFLNLILMDAYYNQGSENFVHNRKSAYCKSHCIETGNMFMHYTKIIKKILGAKNV